MTEKIKKKVHLIAVRVPPEIFRWVKEQAEKQDISFGAVLRRQVWLAMRQEGKSA